MRRTQPTPKKKKPPVIVTDAEGYEIPARLVVAVKDYWEDLDSVVVRIRKRRVREVPVIHEVSPDVADTVEVSKVADVLAASWEAAREDAEDAAGGNYIFEGISEEDGLRRSLFRKSIRVEPDSEGEAGELAETPDAQMMVVAAQSVEKFANIAAKSMQAQLDQHDAYMAGLSTLRTQLIEQSKIMRELDVDRRERDQTRLEHEQTMARIEMLGQTLLAGFGMLGPQLAAKMSKDKEPKVEQVHDDLPKPPGASPSAPCAEAGAIQRALSRMPDLEGFRGKFSDAAWEFWERAMAATSRDALDAAVVGLFRHLGKLQAPEALAEASSWMAGLPPDVVHTLGPVFQGVAQRIQFPISEIDDPETQPHQPEPETSTLHSQGAGI